MQYAFLVKDGNIIAAGGADAAELDAKCQEYLANGYTPSDIAAYEAQVIAGAAAGAADAAGASEASANGEASGEQPAADSQQADAAASGSGEAGASTASE